MLLTKSTESLRIFSQTFRLFLLALIGLKAAKYDSNYLRNSTAISCP